MTSFKTNTLVGGHKNTDIWRRGQNTGSSLIEVQTTMEVINNHNYYIATSKSEILLELGGELRIESKEELHRVDIVNRGRAFQKDGSH